MFPDVKYMKTNWLYSRCSTSQKVFDWQKPNEEDNSAVLVNIVE